MTAGGLQATDGPVSAGCGDVIDLSTDGTRQGAFQLPGSWQHRLCWAELCTAQPEVSALADCSGQPQAEHSMHTVEVVKSVKGQPPVNNNVLCGGSDSGRLSDKLEAGSTPASRSNLTAAPSGRPLWGELEDPTGPPRWRHVRRRTSTRSACTTPEPPSCAQACASMDVPETSKWPGSSRWAQIARAC